MTNPQSPSADDPADSVDREPIRISERPGSQRSTPLRPPPNYLSNRVRLHLAALVFAFLLVLVLMNEARKPENWAWMGFESSTQSRSRLTELPGGSAQTVEPSASGSASRSAAPSNATLATGDEGNLDEGDPLSGSNRNAFNQVQAAGSYEEWSEMLWQRVLAKLQPSAFRNWTGYWVVAAADQSPSPSLMATLPDILSELDQHFVSELSESVSASDRTPELIDRDNEWRRRSEQEWKESRLLLASPEQPQATVAEPVQARQRTAKVWLRRLWPLALRVVEDRTEMTRTADGPAWLLVWSSILRGDSLDPNQASEIARLTSHYELMSQPESFRGSKIQIKGELRGIETILVAPNELNLERYFALWIKPAETGSIPFCVYASQLPRELQAPEQGWQDVKATLEVEGRFFKLRSYLTTGDQVEVCPLILSKQIQMLSPEAAISSVESTSGTISWAIVAYLAFLPIAAAWIAWRVYQSTRLMTRRSRERGETNNEDWKRLGSRGEIKSTRERLAEWGVEQGESQT